MPNSSFTIGRNIAPARKRKNNQSQIRKRAKETAENLPDNKIWHSRERQIGFETLQTEHRLEIEYLTKQDLQAKVQCYTEFVPPYVIDIEHASTAKSGSSINERFQQTVGKEMPISFSPEQIERTDRLEKKYDNWVHKRFIVPQKYKPEPTPEEEASSTKSESFGLLPALQPSSFSSGHWRIPFIRVRCKSVYYLLRERTQYGNFVSLALCGATRR